MPSPLNVCLAIVRWTPVVFITAVVVWSYYAYVVQMCIFTITDIPQKVLYLILYHPFVIMFFWTYWKATFTELGRIPKEFYLSRQDIERFEREENEDVQKEILQHLAKNLPVQCRTNTGAIRYCDKCRCIKPDRAHHCSVCGSCVLKMDHHCPWVNNCVCFTNYKFFVLFLGWALAYCLWVAATSLQYFIHFWTSMGSGDSKDMSHLHIVFLFFVSVMFTISLASLFGYHCFLTSVNRSTLESFRAPVFRTGPDKDGFSLGKHGNFMEIFGDDKRYWFFPIFSSFGDGVTYPIRTVDEDYDSLLGQRQRWMEEGDMENGGPGYDNAGLNQRT